MRLNGTEVEYGMLVEGKGPSDQMDQAAALVRACALPHVTGWDYRVEDPRSDLRGYRVKQLAVDPEDARYDRACPERPAEDLRSDRVLVNGARLYNDHGHPEYATPECVSLRELVAHERAGERIVLECARAHAERLGVPVRIYKNNTDFHGMSYGAHESYLFAREVPFERLQAGLIPFLVTRQIYAGAGKVGVEPPETDGALFQLSQRADFCAEEASVDTLYRRPILNTRDEPHADPRRHRRLHVICGDANLSPFALRLKVGATALVLSLLEKGWQPPFALRKPVDAIKHVSRDPELRWLVETDDGRTIPAVDVQRIYLAAARERGVDAFPEYREVAADWEETLNALERDPFSLADRLDWVAKRQLLEVYREAEGLSWDDATLRSLDLEYHNIDPEEGLFYALEAEGAIRPVVTEEETRRAMHTPPAGTRAAARGACVARFGPAIRAISWNHILLDGAFLDLGSLVTRPGEGDGVPERVAEAVAAIERAASPADLAGLEMVTSRAY